MGNRRYYFDLWRSYDGVQGTARPTKFSSWAVSWSERNRELFMNLRPHADGTWLFDVRFFSRAGCLPLRNCGWLNLLVLGFERLMGMVMLSVIGLSLKTFSIFAETEMTVFLIE